MPEKGAASVHAAVSNGDCAKCHSPHQSALPKLVLAKTPDLCFACHKSVKELVASGKSHAPVDDCTSCHRPHWAKQPRLLVEPVATLCSGCHDVKASTFVKAHLGIDARELRCVSCHSPHASKDEKLFKKRLHPPFAARDCAACHLADKR